MRRAEGSGRVGRAVVRSYPLVAHLIDAEPITGVDVMGKIEDRLRSFGSTATRWPPGSSPSATRGRAPTRRSVAARRWRCSRPCACATCCARSRTTDAVELVRRYWQVTADVVEPWVTDTLAFDHHRLAQIDAQIAGELYETDDPSWNFGAALQRSATVDPDLLRGYLDIAMVLHRGVDVLGRPGLVDTLMTATPAPEPPGPSRAELLALLGASRPL